MPQGKEVLYLMLSLKQRRRVRLIFWISLALNFVSLITLFMIAESTAYGLTIPFMIVLLLLVIGAIFTTVTLCLMWQAAYKMAKLRKNKSKFDEWGRLFQLLELHLYYHKTPELEKTKEYIRKFTFAREKLIARNKSNFNLIKKIELPVQKEIEKSLVSWRKISPEVSKKINKDLSKIIEEISEYL